MGFRSWAKRTRRGFLKRSTPVPEFANARTLLVVDRPGWAFDRIAQQIVKAGSGDVEIAYSVDMVDPPVDILLRAHQYRRIHIFWRKLAFDLARPSVKKRFKSRSGIEIQEFQRKLRDSRVFSTSVYDHAWVEPGDLKTFQRAIEEYSLRVSVSSEKLLADYSTYGFQGLVKLRDGVDARMFAPCTSKAEAPKPSGEPFKVGWVGNSKWGAKHSRDHKGFKTIVLPAIALAKETVPGLQLVVADRAGAEIEWNDMPSFYSSIDALLVTSESEGTPNPALEAMASGGVVISTDVGIINEIAGPEQRRYTAVRREPVLFARAISELSANQNLVHRIGEENLASVLQADWSFAARDWISFLDDGVSK